MDVWPWQHREPVQLCQMEQVWFWLDSPGATWVLSGSLWRMCRHPPPSYRKRASEKVAIAVTDKGAPPYRLNSSNPASFRTPAQPRQPLGGGFVRRARLDYSGQLPPMLTRLLGYGQPRGDERFQVT